MADDKIGTHTSYHASGKTNVDYFGKSGKTDIHERTDKSGTDYTMTTMTMPDGTKVYKDSRGGDDVWRNKDGSVYRGRK